MPTKQLTPEVRKRIAETCQPDQTWFIEDGVVRNNALNAWSPLDWIGQWNSLVRKLAQVIEEHRFDAEGAEQKCKIHDQGLRFIKALATNSVDDLQALLAELMGE